MRTGDVLSSEMRTGDFLSSEMGTFSPFQNPWWGGGDGGGLKLGGGGELGYCRGSVWNGCSEGMCDADDGDVDGDCGG